MELLNEIKEVYKNIQVNKYNQHKGIQTEEDLHLVMKSTQISKDKRKEIIELWRKDPIRKLEEKYGKEMIKRIFQKKKDDICEKEINKILSNFTEDEKIKTIEENV
jgi:predicted ArsR family transcriptional regulator